jgi:hypothetical protein
MIQGPAPMTKIIRLNRAMDAIEGALHALQQLPVKQIVVCAEFADRPEEVMFYGNPTKIFQLLALAQFQIGFRFPLAQWEGDDSEEQH